MTLGNATISDKSRRLIAGTLLLLSCASSAMPQAEAAPAKKAAGKGVTNSGAGVNYGTKAYTLVRQVLTKNYAQATSSFDARMKAALPAAALQSTMDTLYMQAGSFNKLLGQQQTSIMGFPVVFIGAQFERAMLTFKVVFSANGQVSGFFVLPGWNPAAGIAVVPPGTNTATSPAVKPAVVPSNGDEQSVTVGSGEWALPGTLTLPKGRKGPVPAVVLVHGSGPNDRDETLGPNKPFRDLAEGLAAKGIAVLRYDKRTLTYGKRMKELNDTLTVKEETIDDALAAINLLKKNPAIDSRKIFLLGHSLGAMLAPRIAEQDADLAGIIVLAGNTRPLQDLLIEQLDYISSVSGAQSDAEKKKVEELKEQAARIKSITAATEIPANQLPFGVSKNYWLSLKDYHPEKTAGESSKPMLILQGARDYQVTMKDFDGWKQALGSKPNVTMKSYDKLNHLFMEGTGKCTPAEYEKPAHVAPYVISDIAAFVLK